MAINRLDQNSNRLIDSRSLRKITPRISVPEFGRFGEQIRRSTLSQLEDKVSLAREEDRETKAEERRLRLKAEREQEQRADYEAGNEAAASAAKSEVYYDQSGQMYLDTPRPSDNLVAIKAYDRVAIQKYASLARTTWETRIAQIASDPTLNPEERIKKINELRDSVKSSIPATALPSVGPVVDEFAVRTVKDVHDRRKAALDLERQTDAGENVEDAIDVLTETLVNTDAASRTDAETALDESVENFITVTQPNLEPQLRPQLKERLIKEAVTNANVKAFSRIMASQMNSPSLNEVRFTNGQGDVVVGAEAISQWTAAVRAGAVNATLENAPVSGQQTIEEMKANPHSRAMLELRQDIDLDYLRKVTDDDDKKLNSIVDGLHKFANQTIADNRAKAKRQEQVQAIQMLSTIPGVQNPEKWFKDETLTAMSRLNMQLRGQPFFTNTEVQNVLWSYMQVAGQLPDPAIDIMRQQMKTGNADQVKSAIAFLTSSLESPGFYRHGSNISDQVIEAMPDDARAEILGMVSLWSLTGNPEDFLEKRRILESRNTIPLDEIQGMMVRSAAQAKEGKSNINDFIRAAWDEKAPSDLGAITATDMERVKQVLPIVLRSMPGDPNSYDTQKEAVALAAANIAATRTSATLVQGPMAKGLDPFVGSVADRELDIGQFPNWATKYASDTVVDKGSQILKAIEDNPDLKRFYPDDVIMALTQITADNLTLNADDIPVVQDETMVPRNARVSNHLRLLPADDGSMSFEVEVRPSPDAQWRPLTDLNGETYVMEFGPARKAAIEKATRIEAERGRREGIARQKSLTERREFLRKQLEELKDPSPKKGLDTDEPVPNFKRTPISLQQELEEATDFTSITGLDTSLDDMRSELKARAEAAGTAASEVYDKWLSALGTQDDEDNQAALDESGRKVLVKEVVGPAKDVQPKDLLRAYNVGPTVMARAAWEVDKLSPDGSGGLYLFEVANSESSFGRHPETFRRKGDVGPLQLSSRTGLVDTVSEIKKSYASPRFKPGLRRLNEAFMKRFGFDLRTATVDDTYIPIIAMGLARGHSIMMMGDDPELMSGIGLSGRARKWKMKYNSRLGAGSVGGYMKKNSGTSAYYERLLKGG